MESKHNFLLEKLNHIDNQYSENIATIKQNMNLLETRLKERFNDSDEILKTKICEKSVVEIVN